MIEQLKKQLRKQQLREKLSMKSVIAMLVFGAIVLVFVLFGFQGKHNAIGVGSAARVNHTLISVADFQSESQRMEQMYGQLFAGQNAGDAQRQFIQAQALDNLITTELISQGASQQGIVVSDSEVIQFIQSEMPIFKKDGRFQKELYRQILEANRLSPADFESKIRKDIQNQRTRRMFEAAILPLGIETQKLKTLQETKLNIAFAKIDDEQLQAKMQISEAEMQKPLADPEFAKKIESEFKLNQAEYSQTEQVRAAHILLKFATGDAASEAKAKAKITEIQGKLGKEDFAKLAAQYSEDLGSKVNKGDLGFFEKGKMVPEFDQVAFTLAPGTVSEPVKTQFGYHLIKVLEKKPAIAADLEKSKLRIARKILAREKIDDEVKKIETALKENNLPALEASLKVLGVPWEETGFTGLDTEMIPKLGSRLASQSALSLSEANPLLNHLAREGQQKFVLKFKAQKTEALPEGSPVLAQAGRERSYELFGAWIEQFRKKSSIEKNQNLVR